MFSDIARFGTAAILGAIWLTEPSNAAGYEASLTLPISLDLGHRNGTTEDVVVKIPASRKWQLYLLFRTPEGTDRKRVRSIAGEGAYEYVEIKDGSVGRVLNLSSLGRAEIDQRRANGTIMLRKVHSGEPVKVTVSICNSYGCLLDDESFATDRVDAVSSEGFFRELREIDIKAGTYIVKVHALYNFDLPNASSLSLIIDYPRRY